MKILKFKQGMAVVSAGIVFALAMEPLQVSAAESIMPTAGIASMLEARLSTEEYIEAAQQAQGDEKDVLLAAAAAAQAGAKASEQFVSKFGRARSYKEQTIETPDAGAVSTSLFIQGLAEGAGAL